MIIPRRKPYFPPNILVDLVKFSFSKNQDGEVKMLEKDLKHRLGIPNPIVISSGRIGLYLILKASGLKKGSEIIMPGYTFGLLTNFIKKAGFTPIPVDIDPYTFQMSPVAIEKAVTKKTRAILATHLFGEPCDILKIQRITKKYKLFLIEDCAESLGAKNNGKLTGTFGDISLSSFNIAKPLQGITGGLIFGKNKKIITKIRKLILKMPVGVDATKKVVVRGLIGHFLSQTFLWPMLMYIFSFDLFRNLLVTSYRSHDNTKIVSTFLPPYLAHITRLNLVKFKERLVKRKQIRSFYKKHLGNVLDFQKSYSKTYSSNYMIVAKVKTDPLLLRRYLALNGVDIAIKDEVADNCMESNESNITKINNTLIALPVYEKLTEKHIRFVAKIIKNFLSGKSS